MRLLYTHHLHIIPHPKSTSPTISNNQTIRHNQILPGMNCLMTGTALKYCVRIEPLFHWSQRGSYVLGLVLLEGNSGLAIRKPAHIEGDISHGLNVKLCIHAFKPSFVMAPIIGKSRAGHGVYFEDFLNRVALAAMNLPTPPAFITTIERLFHLTNVPLLIVLLRLLRPVLLQAQNPLPRQNHPFFSWIKISICSPFSFKRSTRTAIATLVIFSILSSLFMILFSLPRAG
ncbi:hypothetical protein F5882DRAFT_420000 [Hyaloscypha sp. PMI_1271]|nr:hypothetical protein F5882DRAFT_420000 [Hyaloscypha sp. PMI_1271]